MNKHLTKMLLGVVIAVLALALCLTGCGKQDELQEEIDNVKVTAENALATAQKATADAKTALDNAKSEFQNALAAAATQEDLDQAVADFRSAISANADLVKAIEDLEALKAALADDEEELEKVDEALKEAKEAYEDILDGISSQMEDLVDAIAEINQALADYEEATDYIAEYLDELADIEFGWWYVEDFYYEEDAEEIDKALDLAYFRLMRATSIEKAEKIITDLEDLIDNTADKIDYVNDLLNVQIGGVEGVEYTDNDPDEDDVILSEAEELIDAYVTAGTDVSATAADIALYQKLTNYNGENLVELCEAMRTQYIMLGYKDSGLDVKALIDAVNEKDVVLAIKDEAVDAREAYDAWALIINDDDILNEVIDGIDGFADAITAFEAIEARLTVLENAKTAADTINSTIAGISVVDTEACRLAIKGAWVSIGDWATTYAIPSAAEHTDAFKKYYNASYTVVTGDYLEANYKMVNAAALLEMTEDFEEGYAEYEEAAKDFIDAVDAIEKPFDLVVTPEQLADAWEKYDEWTSLNSVAGFDFIFDIDKTPAGYYSKLTNLQTEYDAMVEDLDNIATAVLSMSVEEHEAPLYFADLEERNLFNTKLVDTYAKIDAYRDEEGEIRPNTAKQEWVDELDELVFIVVKYDAIYGAGGLKEKLDAAASGQGESVVAAMNTAFAHSIQSIDAVVLGQLYGEEQDVTAKGEIDRIVSVFSSELAALIPA